MSHKNVIVAIAASFLLAQPGQARGNSDVPPPPDPNAASGMFSYQSCVFDIRTTTVISWYEKGGATVYIKAVTTEALDDSGDDLFVDGEWGEEDDCASRDGYTTEVTETTTSFALGTFEYGSADPTGLRTGETQSTLSYDSLGQLEKDTTTVRAYDSNGNPAGATRSVYDYVDDLPDHYALYLIQNALGQPLNPPVLLYEETYDSSGDDASDDGSDAP